jgi:hypothetical protein
MFPGNKGPNSKVNGCTNYTHGPAGRLQNEVMTKQRAKNDIIAKFNTLIEPNPKPSIEQFYDILIPNP